MRSPFFPVRFRIRTVKGTNVMSATSLVITMLKKKHRKMSTADSCLVFRVRRRIQTAVFSNSPIS